MSDLEIRGAEGAFKLSKALKAAGRTDTRKTLHKGIREAVKPLIPKARQAARDELPQKGGLAAQVARAPMRAQFRTGQATYGVRLVVGRGKGGVRATNRGTLRHPVFGKWLPNVPPQQVPAGWFDDTMTRNAPAIRQDVEQAVQRVIDDIVRGAQ